MSGGDISGEEVGFFNEAVAEALLIRPRPSQALPFISFALTPDTALGAHARIFAPSNYRVDLCVGSIRILRDVFNRILAHPRLLKSVGNPVLETVDSPTLNDYCTDAYGLPDYDEQPPPMPVCPVRRERARELLQLALLVMLTHEVAHIECGHVALLAAVDSGEAPAISRAEREALEFDADQASIGHVLRSKDEKLRAPAEELVELAAAVAFATQTLLLLDQRLINDPGANTYYQNPRARQLLLVLMLESWAHGYSRFSRREDWRDRVIDVALASVHEGEVAYRLLTGKSCSTEGFDEFLVMQPKPPTIIEVEEGWASVRDKLLPYAYVGLAPADPNAMLPASLLE